MSVMIGIDFYEISVYDIISNEFKFTRRIPRQSSFEKIILDLKNEFNKKLTSIYVVSKKPILNDANDLLIYYLSEENLDFTNYLSVKPSPNTKILHIDVKANSTVKCVLYDFVRFNNSISEYKPIKCFETRTDVENLYELLIQIFDCDFSEIHAILQSDSNYYLKNSSMKIEHFCSVTLSFHMLISQKAVIYGRFLLNDENVQSLVKLKQCSFVSDVRVLKNFDFKAKEHISSYRPVNTYKSQTKLMGIDLGASRVVVCISRNGTADLVKIDDEYSMPSVISFTEEEPIIGSVGMRHLTRKSKSVLYDLKHTMDTKRNLYKGTWPFGVFTTAENSSFVVNSQGQLKQYSTIEIYRILLEKLKAAASKYQSDLNHGECITQAVITIPDFDNEIMLADICEAANLIGIKIIDIITEIHADLLYFLSNNELPHIPLNQSVAVVDIGGGTGFIQKFSFDQGFGKKHDLSFLCGREINWWLENELKIFLFEEYKVEIKNHFEIMAEVERIKESLSFAETVYLNLPSTILKTENIPQVTRTWFEQKVMKVVFKYRTENITMEEALKDVNRFPKPSKLFLVGGTCRIPYIQNFFKSIFGEDKIIVPHNLQEITATGALIHGLQILDDETEFSFCQKSHKNKKLLLPPK